MAMKWYAHRRYTGPIRARRACKMTIEGATLMVTEGQYGFEGRYRLDRSPRSSEGVVFCRHYGPTRSRSWALAMQGLRAQAHYLAAVAAYKRG